MKHIYMTIALALGLCFSSCSHDEWFDRDPKKTITDGQLWNDPKLLRSMLANYYDRMPTFHGVFNTGGMTELDDAMWSGHRDQNGRNDFQYANDYGRYWDYGLIRDINLSLENLEAEGGSLEVADKKIVAAELRFIRAFVYFELVKRMGGVPIVTKQLIYDFSGDSTPLQIPRAKEHEVYDFVFSELEAIKEDLAVNAGSKTKANKFAALALQSRAMLYAASIAKYNSLLTPTVVTPGQEVGIPADKANDYYRKSLNASKVIMAAYQLYNENPDKGANFYDMLNKKTGSEVIFAKDFATGLKVHRFTYDNIVKSMTEDNEASSGISPSLSLVESFEYLDGSPGTLKDKDALGNYVAYPNISDIFANKDRRLDGTVIYPGTNFKGRQVSMQAGVATWVNNTYQFTTSPVLGANHPQGGLWTGFDGPKDDATDVSNTGFYIRKFVSDAPAASTRGTSAANWWPWFRVGEIYLNAAESAFELEETADATGYINTLRARAGFAPNSISTLTMDIIRNERRVELAFEDHRYFDLKRWRIAHIVWNGLETDPDAVVRGLYGYRIQRPGHPDDGKYIFQRMRPTRFRRARLFRLANYYSSIDQTVLNNNPKLERNPFH